MKSWKRGNGGLVLMIQHTERRAPYATVPWRRRSGCEQSGLSLPNSLSYSHFIEPLWHKNVLRCIMSAAVQCDGMVLSVTVVETPCLYKCNPHKHLGSCFMAKRVNEVVNISNSSMCGILLFL
jgi:hypothetical protein